MISEGHVRHDGLSWVQRTLPGSECLEVNVRHIRPGPQRHGGGPRAPESHRLSGYSNQTLFLITWYELAPIQICLCAGYNLSPQAMNVIMKRFSTSGRITFDDFITCCVKLRALTGEPAGGKCWPFQMPSVQHGYHFTFVFPRSLQKERHCSKRQRLLSLWWCKFWINIIFRTFPPVKAPWNSPIASTWGGSFSNMLELITGCCVWLLSHPSHTHHRVPISQDSPHQPGQSFELLDQTGASSMWGLSKIQQIVDLEQLLIQQEWLRLFFLWTPQSFLVVPLELASPDWNSPWINSSWSLS